MIINRKFIFGVIVMFSLVTFNDARGSDDIIRAEQRLAASALKRATKEQQTHEWKINHSTSSDDWS